MTDRTLTPGTKAIPTTDGKVLRLGGRRMLLNGIKQDGHYCIGFTPVDEPLLTREMIDAQVPAPVVILEFIDLEGMQVLQQMVNSMIEDKQRPSWQLVKGGVVKS